MGADDAGAAEDVIYRLNLDYFRDASDVLVGATKQAGIGGTTPNPQLALAAADLALRAIRTWSDSKGEHLDLDNRLELGAKALGGALDELGTRVDRRSLEPAIALITGAMLHLSVVLNAEGR
jgi:hypothetical protein